MIPYDHAAGHRVNATVSINTHSSEQVLVSIDSGWGWIIVIRSDQSPERHRDPERLLEPERS
jgi:hypothetical protein